MSLTMTDDQLFAPISGGAVADDDLIDYSDHEEEYVSPNKSRNTSPGAPAVETVFSEIVNAVVTQPIIVTTNHEDETDARVDENVEIETDFTTTVVVATAHDEIDGDEPAEQDGTQEPDNAAWEERQAEEAAAAVAADDGIDIDFGFPQDTAQDEPAQAEADLGDNVGQTEAGSSLSQNELEPQTKEAHEDGIGNEDESYKIDYEDTETADYAPGTGDGADGDRGLDADDSAAAVNDHPVVDSVVHAEDEITYDDDDQEAGSVVTGHLEDNVQAENPDHGVLAEDEGHDDNTHANAEGPEAGESLGEADQENMPTHDTPPEGPNSFEPTEEEDNNDGNDDRSGHVHDLDEALDTIMKSARDNFNDNDSFDESMEDFAWPVVTVSYKGDEYPMFAPPDKMGFFSDITALEHSVTGLLAAFRSELSAEVRPDEELVFQVDELGLEYSESTNPEHLEAVTLRQIIDIHAQLVKNQSAGSSRGLYTFLFTKPNPSSRLTFIMENAHSGKGLDAVARYFQAPPVQESAEGNPSGYTSQSSPYDDVAEEAADEDMQADDDQVVSSASDTDFDNGDHTDNEAAVEEEQYEYEGEHESGGTGAEDDDNDGAYDGLPDHTLNAEDLIPGFDQAGDEYEELSEHDPTGGETEEVEDDDAEYGFPDQTLAVEDFVHNNGEAPDHNEDIGTSDEGFDAQDAPSADNASVDGGEQDDASNAPFLDNEEQIPIDWSAGPGADDVADNDEDAAYDADDMNAVGDDKEASPQTSSSSTLNGDELKPPSANDSEKNSSFVYDENEIDWREEGDGDAGDEPVMQEPQTVSPSGVKRSRVEAELLDLDDEQDVKRRRP